MNDLDMNDDPMNLLGSVEAGTMSECPRCRGMHDGRFYGPCASCREELRATMGVEAREIDLPEYEPKMNVTPNAVALKDD